MAVVVDKVIYSTQRWAELDLDRPLIDTIFSLARESVDTFGDDQVWIIDGETGEELLKSQIEPFTRQIAAVFQNMGLKPGDTVTVVSVNRTTYHLPVFAAWLCGATANLLDPFVDQKRMEEQFKMVNSKIIVCAEEIAEKVEKCNLATGHKPHILLFEGKQHENMERMTIEKIIRNEPNDTKMSKFVEAPFQGPDAVACVHWTSGTTGVPKGIQLPFKAYSYILISTQTHPFVGYPKLNYLNSFGLFRKVFKKVLHYIVNKPLIFGTNMFHVLGFLLPWSFLSQAPPVVSLRPDLLTPLKIISKMSSYTTAFGVFSYYDMIQVGNLKLDDISKFDVSSMQILFAVGSKPPNGWDTKIKKLFPNIKLLPNGYGLTELAGLGYMATDQQSGGLLYHFSKAKVVNLETGEKCSTHETGEIYINAPAKMVGCLGYSIQDEIDEEGYFKTGDIGYYDKQGLLYFVERNKDMIKLGLHHIYPAEVESVLQKYSEVADVGVFGIPDEFKGEVLGAMVQLVPSSRLTEEKLRFLYNKDESVEDWKVITHLKIVEKLPTTSTGKKSRQQMRNILLKLKQ